VAFGSGGIIALISMILLALKVKESTRKLTADRGDYSE
jgi:hypothetical protein